MTPPLPENSFRRVGEPAVSAPRRRWFLPLPLLSLAVFAWHLGWSSPAWLAANLDPSYAYLFNGLALATGHAPPMCVHPGSTTIDFTALFLRLFHPLASGDKLAASVLAAPEFFIAAANWTLAAAFAAMLALCGWRVARATGSVAAGIAFQSVPLLARQGFGSMLGLRPEPVMLICGVALAAVLIGSVFEPRGGDAIRAGVWLGLGIAAKVHFIPLALPVLVVLPAWRQRWKMLGWLVATFAVATLPSWPAMSSFVNYAVFNLTHKGFYGTGGAGWPGGAEYLRSIGGLVASDKTFFALLVLAAVALPWIRHARLRAVVLALIIAQVFSVLVIAKQPSGHYLAACVSVSGVLGAVIALSARAWKAHRSVVLLCMLMLPLVLYRGMNLYRDWRMNLAVAEERTRLEEVLRHDHAGALVVPYFQRSDPDFALYYGDAISGRIFSSRLEQRLGARVFYDKFDGSFHRGVAPIPVAAPWHEGREVLMTGWVLDARERAGIEAANGITMKDVFGGRIETIYEVVRNEGH